MDKVLTTCVYCGCGCGLFLHVEDGRIVGVSPSPMHPMSKGRLCIKGWLAGDFVSHPDRLKFPMVRREDRFARVSWDEAISIIKRKFREISDKSGPDSLGVLTSAKGTNEENYLLAKLARAGLKTNNVDHVARLCHAPTVVGLGYAFGSGAMTNPISSLAHADVILIVGSNTAEQHPLVASYILEAKANGAKLIVADPRKVQLADLADLHLKPKPGSDVAWINAFLNVIIQDGLINERFIIERTEGFEAVKQSVSVYTPELAESISGVNAQDLRKAAIIFGSAERCAIVYAMGITQHIAGTDNVQALANLSLATGNIGLDGTGLYPLRGHQNVQGSCDMGALPEFYPGYQKVSDAREKFQQAWGTDLPDRPGLTALEMMAAAENGNLKGLLVVGENPVISFPDTYRIKNALNLLDFLMVMDIFPTETTELADVVLPCASFAEKNGTFTSTERRVQRVRSAVAPPGEAKEEWRVINELICQLGIASCYSGPEEIMAEIASVTPIYGGIDYGRLDVNGIHWPCPDRNHDGTPILHNERFPINRARFRPVEYIDPYELINDDYPLILTTGRSLYHFHTGTMTRRTSLLDREVPVPFVEINSDDALAMGIRNGQRIIVETRRGQLFLDARITADISEGTIFVPFHFTEAPANVLTNWALDSQSKISELKVSAARIRRPEDDRFSG
ncbi:MAG: formate dehydrogenase subunit alpha [Methanotrichaceae archaeon]|nr:formate dehydrogenase subunit alpha [Methanotrichaceae archaeon]